MCKCFILWSRSFLFALVTCLRRRLIWNVFYSEYMICFTLLLIHKYAGQIIRLLDFITIRIGSRHSLIFVHARGHACQSGSPVCSGSSRPASINANLDVESGAHSQIWPCWLLVGHALGGPHHAGGQLLVRSLPSVYLYVYVPLTWCCPSLIEFWALAPILSDWFYYQSSTANWVLI